VSIRQLQVPKRLLPLFSKKKRFKVAIGGRGSAKSQTIAALIAARVHQYENYKVVCCRENMNSISDSVHSSIVSQIETLGLDGFTVVNNEIRHERGGSVVYRGLSRNPESLKSMDNIKLAFVEEAQTISSKSLELLTPSIRADDSEIIFAGNPLSSNDPFSKRFIKPFEKELALHGYYEDDLHLIIKINYNDNPFFPESLEQERQYDLINKPPALYRHIWDGDFYDSVDSAIISVEWFNAAVEAWAVIKPEGITAIGFDPSDEGADSKGLVFRHGVCVMDAQEMSTGDFEAGNDWAISYALQKKPDVFVYDEDGMGCGVRAPANRRLGGMRMMVDGYRGSHAAKKPFARYARPDSLDKSPKSNKETFFNRRAQAAWVLRDRFYSTYRMMQGEKGISHDDCIAINPDIASIDLLRSEVSRIPLKPNNAGKIQLATKMEMKAMGISSPNLFDALVMAMTAEPAILDDEPMQQNNPLEYNPYG